MASSPEHPPQFRAPPPSPIANARGHRSAAVNDEDLSEFLDHALHVPDLILPDRIFPSEIPILNLPKVDFQILLSSQGDQDSSVSEVLESVAGFGCFQVVNHGIRSEMMGSVRDAAAGVFEISAENKEMAKRSRERRYGYEEVWSEDEGEEEWDVSEEFYWGRNEEKDTLKILMERIWPQGFSNFSRRTEGLWKEIERVAGKIVQILLENAGTKMWKEDERSHECEEEEACSVLCLSKHGRHTLAGQELSSLKSDVIRMLIRRSDYPHAICIHICDGASEFHIYSSRVGWMSFCPDKDALILTIGDQMQAWSDGLYKHAVGRPIFDVEEEDPISMAFLYSPPTTTTLSTPSTSSPSTISLSEQFVGVICLTLLYHLLLHFYHNFFR